MNFLVEAERLIREFCMKEYGHTDLDFLKADVKDLKRIDLAHSTTDDGEHEVQACVNIIDLTMDTYIDGVLVRTISYPTLGALISEELSWLDFDSLIRVDEEDIKRAEKIKKKEDVTISEVTAIQKQVFC